MEAKFAIARTRSPARETRALPRIPGSSLIRTRMPRGLPRLRRLQWRMQLSTRLSNGSLVRAAWGEGRMLRVRREAGKTRECRGRRFPSDRKVARRRNRVLAVAAHVALLGPANHRAARTRSTQSDKLSHTPV